MADGNIYYGKTNGTVFKYGLGNGSVDGQVHNRIKYLNTAKHILLLSGEH